MQIKKKISFYKLLLISTFFLVACSGVNTSSSETYSLTDSQTTDTTLSTEETTSDELSSSEETTTTDDVTSIDSSTDFSSSTQPRSEKFQIIGINDFHGACNTAPYYSNYSIGLAKLSTFITEKSKNMTTFVISAGDMWQGSIESNSNHGLYVTEAMNIMNFDAMTIGNHELDWGIDKVYANLEVANFPFLGGNIVFKDSQTIIDNIAASTIVEKNGIKIGIIGVIGEDQYRSITHEFVKDLDFVPYDELIISEAQKLKEENVDFIVLSAHEDWGEGTVASSLNSSDRIAVEKKRVLDSGLIDLVLHAHTHSYSKWYYNNIPLLRAVANGEAYDIVEVSFENNLAKITNSDVHWFTESEYKNLEEDVRITSLYNEKYNVDEYSKTVIGYSDGYISGNNFAKFCAESIFNGISELDYYREQSFFGAFTNAARKPIYKGDITIGMIWGAIPFDDEILIMNLKGSTIKRCDTVDGGYLTLSTQVGIYPFNCCDNLNNEEIYEILVIDYLGYKIKEDDIIDEVTHTGRYLRDLIIDNIIKIGVINASKYN